MFDQLAERAVSVAIGQIQGYFRPTDAEREAAWELLVELSTRTTVTPLRPGDGLLREALTSVYSLFETTRTVLRTHGMATGTTRADGNLSLAVIAIRVLNDVLRPTLSRWHPKLEAWEATRPDDVSATDWEARWVDGPSCRAELNALRADVRAYLDTLGRIAGTHAVAGAVTPLPPSRPVAQTVLDRSLTPLADAQPRQRMVRWLDLAEMVPFTRAKRLAATVPDRPKPSADGAPRHIAPAAADGSFTFDYVADLGDGFDPTMAVAWQVSRPELDLPTHPAGELPAPDGPLRRGSLLVFGGDQVYPWASTERYRDQLSMPYQLAAAGAQNPPPEPVTRPTVVAIPGNHDWLGGIGAFDRVFCDGQAFAGHWNTVQDQRFFAVQLPHGWWLWGIDTGLQNTVDTAQAKYFLAVGLRLAASDRVIVCTPVPMWQLRQRDHEAYVAVRGMVDRALAQRGARVPLYLSGDSHVFAHYRRVDAVDPVLGEHHVTCGGGGAFLQPTHNLPEQIPYEAARAEYVLDARWPLPADSRALAPGGSLVADRQSRFGIPALLGVHALFAAAAAARLGLGVGPDRPGAGWRDALGWVAGAPLTWLLALATLAAIVVSTKANSVEPGARAGARRYGATLGAAEVGLLYGGATVGRWDRLDQGWWWRFLLVPAVAAVVSLGVYLAGNRAINARIRASDNIAFAVGHLTRYKHFLRLRIDATGTLAVYAIGLDPVGVGWWKALTGLEPPVPWWRRRLRRQPPPVPSGIVPPFDPAGAPRLHYLWGIELPPSTPTAPAAGTGSAPDASLDLTLLPDVVSAPVTVVVAFHPDDVDAPAVAQRLLRRLSGNPDQPGAARLGVPVRFRTITAVTRADDDLAPLEVAPGDRALVVALAGDRFLVDGRFRRWTAAVQQQVTADPSSVRLVGVAMSTHALGASDMFGTRSLLRPGATGDALALRVEISVLAALCDLLSRTVDAAPRLKVFISHAKADGRDLALALDQRIALAKLDAFVDEHHIVEGSAFDEAITGAFDPSSTALVAVVTDAYPSREWCRIEALTAKQSGVPVVVLDAVLDGHDRSFPYLGNVPLVRTTTGDDDACDRVLAALLLESVRTRWFPQRMGRLGTAPGVVTVTNPPELLTLHTTLRPNADAGNAAPVVRYPDPPLATAELRMLQGSFNVALRTPIEEAAMVEQDLPSSVLGGFPWVALSISEPPVGDLVRLGLTQTHVDLAFVELATHLLAGGYSLSYGGDLRFRGFTDRLLDLSRAYSVKSEGIAGKRVRNYLAASLFDKSLADEGQRPVLAAAQNLADIVRVEGSTEGAHAFATQLLAMRRLVTVETFGKVVLGGRVFRAAGRVPGVIEEAWWSVELGRPLYVAGGFGGAAAIIARALDGTLTAEQMRALGSTKLGEGARSYDEVAETQRSSLPDGVPVTVSEMLSDLSDRRPPNGLTGDENARLATTSNLDEMIELVLRGLRTVRGG